ncbi:MAG: M23 family metallopeptidase [Cyanobium sp.]
MTRPLPTLLRALAPLLLGLAPAAPLHAQPFASQPLPPLPSLQPPRPDRLPPETPVAALLSGAPATLRTTPDPAIAAPPPLLYPLPERAGEQDPYGWRWSDRRQAWRMHAGTDLIAPAGTPVLAMAPGRVLLAEEINGYGLTVLLDHGGGWQSLYAHLHTSTVGPGERLRAGDTLGTVGRSGSATTDHLHVELRRRLVAHHGPSAATAVVAVDPAPLLSAALQRLPLQQAQGIPPASP